MGVEIADESTGEYCEYCGANRPTLIYCDECGNAFCSAHIDSHSCRMGWDGEDE
jgi:predicted amidophosphoribosyltransferase